MGSRSSSVREALATRRKRRTFPTTVRCVLRASAKLLSRRAQGGHGPIRLRCVLRASAKLLPPRAGETLIPRSERSRSSSVREALAPLSTEPETGCGHFRRDLRASAKLLPRPRRAPSLPSLDCVAIFERPRSSCHKAQRNFMDHRSYESRSSSVRKALVTLLAPLSRSSSVREALAT